MFDVMDSLMQEQFVIKCYNKEIEKVAYRHQLTKIELDILLYLASHPTQNTAKDIVKNRLLAKSFVSKALIMLEKNQFITLCEDKTDRRVFRIELQKKAEDVLNEGKKVQFQLKELIKKTLSEEELKQFIILIFKIKEAFRTSFEGRS